MTIPLTTIELLSQRSDWIRALARRLVDDRELADDVAQEASLEALKSSAAARHVGPAWLAGVVRNVAKNLRRKARVRGARELQVAVQRTDRSAADSAAFVEQQRLLADAVLALDPPFRDVVLLRFFEARPQREIAAALEVPVATVNSRLTRALAKLRAQLDRVHDGDRRAWVTALAPIALAPRTAGVATLGVVTMKKQLALVVGLFVLLGVGAGLFGWFPFAGSGDAEPIEPSGGPVATSVVPEPDPSVRPSPEPGLRREPNPAPSESRPRVRVIAARTRKPIPSADVRRMGERTRGQALDRTVLLRRASPMERVFAVSPRVALDANASFALPADGTNFAFVARAGDRKGQLLLHARDVDKAGHVLELWPIQTARVTVRDASARPLAAVPVALRLRTRSLRAVPIAILDTGRDGRVDLEWYESLANLGHTTGTLEAALAFPNRDDVHTELVAEADRVQDIEWTCPPAGKVRVVVDTVRGPAPDGLLVHLGLGEMQGPVGFGTFVMETKRGVAEFWPVGIGMKLEATTWWRRMTQLFTTRGDGPSRVGETSTWHLMMTGELRSITGRVVGVSGRPLAGQEFFVQIKFEEQLHPRLSVETDAKGRFSCEDVLEARPGAVLEVTDPKRLGVKVTVPIPVRNSEGPIDVGDVRFANAGPTASGIVVDEDGEPVPGVWVEFLVKSDIVSTGWRRARMRSVKTDAGGRFELFDEAPKSELWITVKRTGPWRHEPQRWVPGERGTRLVLHRAGALAGKLKASTDVPLDRIDLELWPEKLGPIDLDVTRGWVGAAVSNKGAFEFSALEPGIHTLAVFLVGRNLLTKVAGIRVGKGTTTRDPRLDPLDLTELVRAIRLRVRNEGGATVRASVFALLGKRSRHLGWSDRELLLPKREELRTVVVQAEGYFPVDLGPVAGQRDVVVRAGIAATVRVLPVPHLEEPYSLRVSLVPSTPQQPGPRGRSGRSFSRRGTSPDHASVDANGVANLHVLAPGEYRLRFVVRRLERGYLDEVDVTPERTPVVRITEHGSNRADAVLDQATVNRALDELRKKRR